MTFTNSTNFLRFVSNFFCFLDKRKCFFSSLNIHSAIFLLILKVFFGFTTKWMFCNFMLHENDRMLINCGQKKRSRSFWKIVERLYNIWIVQFLPVFNVYSELLAHWQRQTKKQKHFQLEFFKVYEWEKTLSVFKIWKEQDFFISFVSFDIISLPLRHLDIQKHAR